MTTITLRQAQKLLAFFGGHDCEVTITEQSQDGAGGTPGLHAHCTEYSEEGSIYLGPTAAEDDPAADGKRMDYPPILEGIAERNTSLTDQERGHLMDLACSLRARSWTDWKQAFEQEREKFQRETLRTSELTQMLTKLVALHCPVHSPGPWARGCWQCKLVGDAQALLGKPVNDGAALPVKGDGDGR